MADEVDMAQELEQLALRHALAHRKAEPGLKPRGSCYNCAELLQAKVVNGRPEHAQIFCDSTCADDWERRKANRRQRI